MAASSTALVPPIDNPALAAALSLKLRQRGASTPSLGSSLQALALRLGLIHNSETPHFEAPAIVVFAADHGLAVDNLGGGDAWSTAEVVHALLDERLPVAAFARAHGLDLTVVDSGVADSLAPHSRLLARKIGHGTRNARASAAMSLEQAHAALRAGMEIADAVPGNAVACCGIGVGSAQSAALVLAQIANVDVREFAAIGGVARDELDEHRIRVLEGARHRHGHLENEIEILAAVGGFEIAMMAGLMLAAAARRRLIMADGLPACAALLVASFIAPAVSEYCVHSRSNSHAGLDRALALFDATAFAEEGLDAIDGTGAALAWPRMVSAAALLADVTPARDPGRGRQLLSGSTAAAVAQS